MNCCPCCFWRQRQYPIFDYDEVDDLEFENLLTAPGPGPFTPPPTQTAFWTRIASLFGFHPSTSNNRGYEPVSSLGRGDDLLVDQYDAAEARLLTQEQVAAMTNPFINYTVTHKMNTAATDESSPVELDSQEMAKTNTISIASQNSTSPLENQESPDQEMFDPKLLSTLTKYH